MSAGAPREAQFQGAVIELAELRGWRCYHTFDSRHSNAGFPDLVLVRDGRLIFAELKSDTGKVSPSQQVWLDELSETPAEVHVWRPSDWESIFEILKPPGFSRGGVVRNRTAAESETPR